VSVTAVSAAVLHWVTAAASVAVPEALMVVRPAPAARADPPAWEEQDGVEAALAVVDGPVDAAAVDAAVVDAAVGRRR
jgi:hypothetical protein